MPYVLQQEFWRNRSNWHPVLQCRGEIFMRMIFLRNVLLNQARYKIEYLCLMSVTLKLGSVSQGERYGTECQKL